MAKFWILVLLLSIIATSLTSMVAPNLLSWYATPPVDIGVDCGPAIQWGLTKLIWIQAGSGILGGILGAALYFFLRKRQAPTHPAA